MTMNLRVFFTVMALAGAAPAPTHAQEDVLTPKRLAPVRAYIKSGWTTLTRSSRDIAKAAADPKFKRAEGQPWLVYYPPAEDRARLDAELKATLSPADLAQIELRPLPQDRASIKEQGLLYLPHPYVVPGGRFNEMYGWDSYFIQVGLLQDGEVQKAKDVADNFLYEIANYGTILNANRTYYLYRSQPPFLTEMVLGVYRKTKDKEWLRAALPAIDAYYRFWTTEPHLVPGTGLSRYWDFGEGPAPEVLSDEKDAQGRTHYDRIREYYRDHPDAAKGDYDLDRYYDRPNDRLTELFYKGDRSMRESGFDPSNRFGLFNVDIVHYAPVCLNSLLYRMELEAAEVHEALGRTADGKTWRERAAARKKAMDAYLWDDAAGLYLDYDFETKTRRHYEFATTFWPLWVGAASPAQARRVHASLKLLEAPHGLLTSTRVTGNQWDAPFGWAPLQMIAVDGLRRYGFAEAADRLARKFLSTVVRDFEKHGTIVEKYDVQRGTSDLGDDVKFGYSYNVVGFGWTNAAVVEMLAGLDHARPVRPLAKPAAAHAPPPAH